MTRSPVLGWRARRVPFPASVRNFLIAISERRTRGPLPPPVRVPLHCRGMCVPAPASPKLPSAPAPPPAPPAWGMPPLAVTPPVCAALRPPSPELLGRPPVPAPALLPLSLARSAVHIGEATPKASAQRKTSRLNQADAALFC